MSSVKSYCRCSGSHSYGGNNGQKNCVCGGMRIRGFLADPVTRGSRLMGAIQQNMGPVNIGDAFQFGFNIGGVTGSIDQTGIVNLLESSGLSYQTQIYQPPPTYSILGYTANPYYTIEGNSINYYDSGTDFGNDILNLIQQSGGSIDPGSIQFRTFSGATGAVQGTPYPNQQPGSNQSGSNQPSSNCPAGQYDNSWFGGLFGSNCVPIGSKPSSGSGIDLTSLGIGAGSGVLLAGAFVVLLLVMRK